MCNSLKCWFKHPLPYTIYGVEGRFTLRWRSPPVMNSRGILKFEWPRATLLSGGGYTTSKRPLVENIVQCTWMKKWHGCQCGDTFLTGSSPEVKFLAQPQSLGQETWPPENSNLNKYFIVFSSSPTYHPLPPNNLVWAKTLYRLVHFSTVM